jgi:hypothetical protein
MPLGNLKSVMECSQNGTPENQTTGKGIRGDSPANRSEEQNFNRCKSSAPEDFGDGMKVTDIKGNALSQREEEAKKSNETISKIYGKRPEIDAGKMNVTTREAVACAKMGQ